MVTMLKHFQRHIQKPLIIIWDRAPTHKARVVKDYVDAQPAIDIEWLPPYAPEVNPEEFCHGNAKAHLRNVLPQQAKEVERLLNQQFDRIRKNKTLILSFFRHAELRVKQLS